MYLYTKRKRDVVIRGKTIIHHARGILRVNGCRVIISIPWKYHTVIINETTPVFATTDERVIHVADSPVTSVRIYSMNKAHTPFYTLSEALKVHTHKHNIHVIVF